VNKRAYVRNDSAALTFALKEEVKKKQLSTMGEILVFRS
jgi:hypothetical protein